jgi:uncharacterized Zn-finger protein
VNKQNITQRYIEVTADDLPLACPMPNMNIWNAHPKVMIPMDHGGEARCPYCGTLYKFKIVRRGCVTLPCLQRHNA